ncbi:ankyrin repeat protein, partial [Trifolium medium]|nr:ankyrin repeat protein [Trifolium medium]
MMWDIKWYKYIQGLVPEHFQHRFNKDDKIPGEIFNEKHEDLLEKSLNWLKDTAQSCSVVAALIAGLSFATSGSVPGGNNESGKPILEGQPAFEGFAISSSIGLYSSGTAVIMFLAILTSRNQIKDFNIILPTKLLVGLTSLFVSIVAMFISFCAGHFFVLTDKY